MNRSLVIVILSALLVCALVPTVSAAPTTTVTTTATVPPILQACSRPVYPIAWFNCTFPANQTAVVPDGPPYTIECTDLSYAEQGQPIGTWSWEFGDGATSTLRNPLHSYTGAGMHTVRLTVTTLCGRQYSNTTTGSVSVYCTVPEPGFSPGVTEGSAPLSVQVTDTSRRTPAGITTWTYWQDNTPVSNERNPVFTFTAPGAYTISQTVRKECVQPGSSPLPPFSRTILVSIPPTTAAVNASNTTAVPTPAASLTTAAPVLTTAPTVPAPTQDTLERPETGTLSVISEPAGAQVFVDDVVRGTSPLMVGLLEGSHSVRLEKEGYNSTTAPVLITSGKTTEYSVTLVSVSGGIAIVPLIALVVIIIGVIFGGLYLYRQHLED